MLEVTKYNTYMHAFFFLIINIHTNIQPMTHTSYMHKQGYSINFFFLTKTSRMEWALTETTSMLPNLFEWTRILTLNTWRENDSICN